MPEWLKLLSGTTVANSRTIRVNAARVLLCLLLTCIFFVNIRIPHYCRTFRQNYQTNSSIHQTFDVAKRQRLLYLAALDKGFCAKVRKQLAQLHEFVTAN
jgi:hypothetical protein